MWICELKATASGEVEYRLDDGPTRLDHGLFNGFKVCGIEDDQGCATGGRLELARLIETTIELAIREGTITLAVVLKCPAEYGLVKCLYCVKI